MLCVFGNGCLCVLLFCVPGLVLVLMGKYCWGLVILGHEEKCTHEIYWGSGTAIYFSVMGYLLMCSDSSCAYILVVITLLLPAALLTYILTGYLCCLRLVS